MQKRVRTGVETEAEEARQCDTRGITEEKVRLMLKQDEVQRQKEE